MSERYSRLFTLPENLYAVGSPVVIAAGALLKDNQKSKIVAQLKFKNISEKAIKAIKVKLDLFNTAGNALEESVDYEYLDLNEFRDVEFGQKIPVMIPNVKARSYKVSVAEVVFSDRSVWTGSCENWEPLNKPSLLVCGDYELRKQYQIKYGEGSKYEPKTEKDLWFCTCGAINRAGEICHICHNSLFELQTVDMAKLEEERDARLTEEARAAAEKAREEAEKQAAVKQAQKRMATFVMIAVSAVCALVAIVLLVTKVVIPNHKYNNAVELMEAGRYVDAIDIFRELGEYKDAPQMIDEAKERESHAALEILYQEAAALVTVGNNSEAAMTFAGLGDYRDAREQSFNLWKKIAEQKTIAAGYKHSVAVKKDGTAVAAGAKRDGQCNVSGWKNIVAVDAENGHTVGLKADGTVIAAGWNEDGQCNVSDWTDIVAIAAGSFQTIGLKADGTVMAVGWKQHGQCNVSDWTDMVAISAGGYHTVGVKADGTVKAVGNNDKGQCNVSAWTDIVAIAAGKGHTVGLKADGTVVAAGWNDYGQCNVSDWSDIVAISADNGQTVGLKADGTVVAVGYNEYGQCDISNWTDIVGIAAGSFHTLGLKADGSLITAGWNKDGQCNVSAWKNIRCLNET